MSQIAEDPEEHAPLPLDSLESPPEPYKQGRQRAAAAVRTMHPPLFWQDTIRPNNTKKILYYQLLLEPYVVPDGDQAPGGESDGYRLGLKRKFAAISRSQYEVYSFATKHNLSEAAVDELLGMLNNVCT